MAEHYPRNQVSTDAYCKKCGKVTQHRVDDRRKGPCLKCIARLEQVVREKQARDGARIPAVRQRLIF